MKVTFTVRRSDFVSMYLGSWAARMLMVPGVLMLLAALPTNLQVPLANYASLAVTGLVLVVAAPAFFCWLVMSMYRTDRLTGRVVELHFDETGVSGWPLAEYPETSWANARKARRFRGVITLPFGAVGRRAGWVPIPERELSKGELDQLVALLAARGLMKAQHGARR